MLAHKETQSLMLRAEDPFTIRGLIPKSRSIQYKECNVAVQHTLESTKILRNIGINAPAPIRFYYNWPGRHKPMEHQIQTGEFATLHHRLFILSDPGTCKTAATLWTADYLMKQGVVQKALVISPLSTLNRVWTNEVFDFLMHRTVAVVHGGTAERKTAALETDVDFYIMNHAGVSRKYLRDAIRKRPDINLIIVDEGSVFRNADSKQYKDLESMLRPDQRLWWLTGTPCPNAPTDAWSQVRLVNKNNVPKYFGSFKRMTMLQVSTYKWVPKPDAYEIAYAAMQPAIRFRKSECLDLPPVTIQSRQADLSPEQQKAFNSMRSTMVAEAKTQQIKAVNAADKITKLRQILCGSVKDTETGDYITIPHGPRFQVLLESIQYAAAKVIVIVPFKGIIYELAKELKPHYTLDILNGDVTPKNRDRIIKTFQQEKDPHLLLCHSQVMSHGLTLVEADVLIFYGPIYSNDQAGQVTERINRPGQTRKMTIIRIAAHPLEWEIYKMLDTKKVTQDNILKLYESIIA